MEHFLPPTTWNYEMRREMQEIIRGLYLGPYAVAVKSQLNTLKQRGITHIVCVRSKREHQLISMNHTDSFRYLDMNIEDSILENIIPHIPQVKIFIDECLLSGGKVLVHGNGGTCRSAALVTGYLIETFDMSYQAAMDYVRDRRFCVYPRQEFQRQLNEYEYICQARRSVQQPQSDHTDFKRKTTDAECSQDLFNESICKLLKTEEELPCEMKSDDDSNDDDDDDDGMMEVMQTEQ